MANPPKSRSFALLGSSFAITAFVLMWIGSIRCSFLKFRSTSAPVDQFDLELGLWFYQYWSLLISTSGAFVYESCNPYPDFTAIDASWKAARAFGIITFVFAIVMLIVACISACTCNRGYALTHVWEAPAYLLTAICQGLVLLLLNSNACKSDVLFMLGGPAIWDISFEKTCSIATGAKLVICATVFWFCAAVSSFFAHRAEVSETTEEGGEVIQGEESGQPEKEGDVELATKDVEPEKAAEKGETEKATEEPTEQAKEHATEQAEDAQ